MGIELEYPETERKVVIDTLHGEVIKDQYRWLESFESEKVKNWIEKQNKLYISVMRKLERNECLYEEYLKLYRKDVMKIPKKYRDRYFYEVRRGLSNHYVVYMSKGGIKKGQREILNPNRWSTDGSVSLDWFYPSPDGSLVAYGKSAEGSEESTLYVRNTAEREDLPVSIPRTRHADIVWLPDNTGFYYTRYPNEGEVPEGDENYYRRLYLHRFGHKPSEDELIFGENRKKEEWVSAYKSSCGRYVMIYSSLDWTKNDLYMMEMESDGEPVTIAENLDGRFTADVYNGKIYIYTNWKSPNGRILKTDIRAPTPDNWETIIPEGEHIMEEFKLIGNRIIVRYMENVHSKVSIFSLDGEHIRDLQFPTMGSAKIRGCADSPELFCGFESYFYPTTIYRINLETGEGEEIFQIDVDRNLDDYTLKQIGYPSKDGTEIPLWIMHRNDIKQDGNNPTILTGYGGFGVPQTPYFSRTLLPWLDRGGIYAVACLRGGGEFGREWHEAGRLFVKQNTFDDFIEASEWLIENRWTNRDKLAIEGGSNGGLLVGAVMTQRPDLYGAVVCNVPLLDMLRYDNYTIARLWIPEYGTSRNEKQFYNLLNYSPYHNVKKDAEYPPTLFTAGVSDIRVHPMHAMKMTALLQYVSSENNPVLLYVEPKAGHGHGKPLTMALRDISRQYLFIMWQLEMI